MSDETSTPDVETIKAEIEDTRQHLAESVDALAAKADVKARASEKIDDVKHRARDAVTDDAGDVRPAVPAAGVVAALLLVGLVVVLVRRRRR